MNFGSSFHSIKISKFSPILYQFDERSVGILINKSPSENYGAITSNCYPATSGVGTGGPGVVVWFMHIGINVALE
jgi:hypothetical protein